MSYFPKNLEGFRSISYDSLLYCKTNIGGYFFDGYLNLSVNSNLEITQHPVETGSDITDHAYLKPREISMTIIMSDAHESLVAGQFEGGWSRSVQAWKILEKIQQDRLAVSVLTRVGLYQNMLIQTLTADDTDLQISGLKAQVTLVELPVARVRTVEISAADQTTVDTEMGNISAVYPSDTELQSLLYMLAGYLRGET